MKQICKAALLAASMVALCSCNAWPQFFRAADDIATDTAIKMEVSKEAIPAGSLIQADIKITPPSPPIPPPASARGILAPQG